jgi:2-oxoglutarate dehydrogenase E2 component (dihydrolipoamide succinyltransferase)
MPTEIIMPQMGESIFEGTITKWLKAVGDTVAIDEPLFEISTDKVDAEIPSSVAGVLAEIRFPEGATVEVNTVVGIIGEAGSVVATPNTARSPVQKSALLQIAPKPQVAAPAAGAPEVPALSVAAGRRIRSSPLARRIAKEHGVELGRVAGSGSEGRITKDDVLRAASSGSAQQSGQRSAATQLPPVQQVAPLPHLATLPADPVPLTRMRAIIAERMVESVRTSPHVYTVYKVDMTRIARLREQRKANFDRRHHVKLTFMPFIAAAAVAALRRCPIVNASLENGASLESTGQGLAIRYHRSIDLGIAVALDWGLIVPVIRHAEQRSFSDLARTIADLALRARSKKLSPDEVGGSTFTLTNAGAFGGEYGMPIINQPESAILAVGGLRKEPAVLTDAEGNDTIAIRSMQYFCLGFDHRLIDGADGGKFMLEFKKTLEGWNQEIG